MFQTYRELKVKVLTHLKSKSLERAELTNRFRRSKSFQAGDRVIVRDPRHKRAGGRTPYKQPLRDGLTVKKVKGNTAVLTRGDGTEIHDVHFEDMLLVSEQSQNLSLIHI